VSTDRKYGEDIPDEKLFEKLVGATDKRIQELERGKTELLAEVNALTMILAHAKGDNNTLREEIAALTAALDEATACSVCNGHPPDGGCHCGTPGKWEGNVTPGRRHDVMCKLTTASRDLCERLFGGAK